MIMLTSKDEFLPLDLFKELADYAINDAKYEDVINPADGVTYPKICQTVPQSFLKWWPDNGLTHKELKTVFLRQSPEGVEQPNQVHSDISMGQYSLILYISPNDAGDLLTLRRPWIGTEFVYHKDLGLGASPRMPGANLDYILADQNNPERWEPYFTVEIRPNRALFFDSRLLHRQMPLNGATSSTGIHRTVLVAFL